MIALSFTIISAALDIVTIMLLRLLLKLVIGNGVAYFSLSNLILLFFYFAFAFPLRLSVSREAVKTVRRGGDVGAPLKPGLLISVPGAVVSALLMILLSGFLSEKAFLQPYLFLSLVTLIPGLAALILSSAHLGILDAVSAPGSFFVRKLARILLLVVPAYLGSVFGKKYGASIALILLNEKEGEVLGSAGAVLGMSLGLLVIMTACFVITPLKLRKAERKSSVSMDTARIAPTPSIVSTLIPETGAGGVFMICVILCFARCSRLEGMGVTFLTRIFGGTDSFIFICISLAMGVASLFLIKPLDTLESDERKKYRARLSRSVRYATAMSLPFASFCGALSAPLHNVLTGSADLPGFVSVLSFMAVPGSVVFLLFYITSFEEMSYFRGLLAVLAASLLSLAAGITYMGRGGQGSAYGVMIVFLLAPVLSAVVLFMLKYTSGRDRIRGGDIVTPLLAGVILTVISVLLRLLIAYLAGPLTAVIICTVLNYFIWIILMRVFGILSAGFLGKLPGGGIASLFGDDR